MEISKFNIENSTEITLVQDIDIDIEIFMELVQKIVISMKKIGIRTDNKSIYYQRYYNRTSFLAIKVCNGEDNDMANYMFNGCDANYFEKYKTCDVYLHADAKSSQRAISISNLISNDIVDFFNKLEEDLSLKEMLNSEFCFRIPLDNNVDKDMKKDNNRVLKLIRSFFRK